MFEGIARDRKVFVGGKELLPGYSQSVLNHSPCGYEWGYTGSGPAQLSLAILLVYLPTNIAVELHQGFKEDIISKFEIDRGWEMECSEVKDWIKKNITTEQAGEMEKACTIGE